MPIKKVTGKINYYVEVNCPYCNGPLNLNQPPYTENDPQDVLGMMLFGSLTVPAKWDNLNLRYECCYCKEEFLLEKLEC